jgi:hypothetical protein
VIRLHAGEAQAAFGRRMSDDVLRQLPGCRRRNAAATVADVDLDQHLVLPEAATAAASRSTPATESIAIASRTRRASAATRASLAGSTTSFEM